jgi:hypothetical protein
MNYAFYFIGFIPLYTLINIVIFQSIYKKWIKEKSFLIAFPKWNGTLKPKYFVGFRLSFILASYFTPWLFLSSPRAALFNLFIFLPAHLIVDEIINRFLQKRRSENGALLLQRTQTEEATPIIERKE